MSHVLSAVAWPYANGPRHIGHVAGFGVPSDVFSRYMRMAGHDVLMVSGTDEHGTPILVLAEQEGVDPAASSPTGTTAVIAEDLADLGLSYDLFTRTTTAQPLRRRAGAVPAGPRQRLHDRADHQGRDQPVDGAHPARPLHRGHLPDLRLRRARAATSATTAATSSTPTDLIDPRSKINGETPEFVETQHFFLDLPALADALARVARRARGLGHLAPQRHQVQPQPPRGPAPARDDPRHRLGHPGPARGLGRQPHQAALRLVRRGHRLPVGLDRVGPPHRRPRSAGASGGTTRRRVSYYFMGKDNITFHSQIWPAELLGYAGKGDSGGEPGVYGELNLPTEVVVERVPDHGGQAVLDLARLRHLRAGRRSSATAPTPLRYFICAAGPGEPGRRLHLGASSSSATTASWSPAGATSSTARPRWSPKNFGEIPQPGAARAGRRGACWPPCARAFDTVGACSSGTVRRRPSPRRCASSARPTSTSREPSRSSSRATTSASAWRRCCTRSRRPCPTSTPCSRRSCRTRPTGCTRSSAATGEFMPMPRVEEVDGPRRRGPLLPRHHGRLLARRRAGSRGRSPSARRSRKPTRSSPSSTPSRSSPTSARLADPGAPTCAGSRARGRHGMSPHGSGNAGCPSARPTRCPSRSSTTTAPRHRREGDEPLDVARRRSGAPRPVGVDRARPGRLRPPGDPVHVETPSSGIRRARRRSPCTPTRRRGWPRAVGSRRRTPRSSGSRPTRPGAGHRRDRASTTSAPGRRACRSSRTRFRWHIDLAKRLGKALQIHDRDAHADVLRILDEEGAPERTVLHCFSGDLTMARECVDRGYYLSLRRHGDLQERPGPARRPGRRPRSTGCSSRPTRPT